MTAGVGTGGLRPPGRNRGELNQVALGAFQDKQEKNKIKKISNKIQIQAVRYRHNGTYTDP